MECGCECIEFIDVDSRQGDDPLGLGWGVTLCEVFYKALDVDRSFGVVQTTKIGVKN
jgi:hypothetical protein